MNKSTLDFSSPLYASRERQLEEFYRYKITRLADSRRAYTDAIPKEFNKNPDYSIWDNFEKKEIY